MEDNRQEKYEEKMERYEASEERREHHMKERERENRKPWYSSGKFWLYVGVIVACSLLIYWVLFIAIWDGPNQ